jgi:hypothetical protein
MTGSTDWVAIINACHCSTPRSDRSLFPDQNDLETGSQFVSQALGIVGYSAHVRLLTSQNAKRFSYNKRTMESAMVPFLPLWPYEESITYVLSTH